MSREPVSRRERPAKPALSRAGIVTAAVTIMRADGLERLTMRRLAQELDTGAASLYVYVRDTAELHAAVLDELLGEVDLGAGSGDWRERLWALLESYRAVLHGQPGLARVALVSRLSGPNYLGLVDTALGLLREGGLPAAGASWALDLLFLVSTASAVEHGTRAVLPDAGRQHDALVAAVEEASSGRYPHIAVIGPALLSGTGPARSRWAFDVLLDGAAATPVPDGG